MRYYVYELRDPAGVVFYVGKGSGRRMQEHKYKAKSGQQTRRAERIREIVAAGGRVQEVKVFETDDQLAAFAEEMRLIAHYGRENLTNDTDGGEGPLRMSATARAKIAAARRGKVASAETREKQRAAKIGTKRDETTKAKIASTQRTRPMPWKSRPLSPERKAKLSALNTGRKMPPGTGAKISAAKMGHKVSDETRAKISATKRQKHKEKQSCQLPTA